MTPRTIVAAIWLVTLLSAGDACSQQPRTPPPPSPSGAPTPEQIVEAWLLCDDCSSGERAALVNLGAAAVPLLTTALRDGPQQPARDSSRQKLTTTYRSMVEYAKTHPEAPVPMTEAEYISRHTDNFVRSYQKRAASGLGAIGGPQAKGELTRALSYQLPPDVLATVRASLERMP